MGGLIIKAPCLLPPGRKAPWSKIGESSSENYWYQDHHYWEVPEEDDDDSEDLRLTQLNLHREHLDAEIETLMRHRKRIEDFVSGKDVELGSISSSDSGSADSGSATASATTSNEEKEA